MKRTLLVVGGIAACAGGERPEVVCGRATLYEIDRLDLPMSSAQASSLAVNLDGDDRAIGDNVVGAIRVTLVTSGEVPLPSAIAPAELPVLAVTECSDRSIRARLGDGDPAEGTFDTFGLTARGGTGSFPLADLLLERPTGERVPVVGLGIDPGDEIGFVMGQPLSGSIGFGVSERVVHGALADEANLVLARDAGCPSACATYAGQYIVSEVDRAPVDGVVTLDEIASGLWADLIDVDLVGDDGVDDHVSVGVGFHAVPLRK